MQQTTSNVSKYSCLLVAAVTTVLTFIGVSVWVGVSEYEGEAAVIPVMRRNQLVSAVTHHNCSDVSGVLNSVVKLATGQGYLHAFELERIHPCCMKTLKQPQHEVDFDNNNNDNNDDEDSPSASGSASLLEDIGFIIATNSQTQNLINSKGVFDTWGYGLENVVYVSDKEDPVTGAIYLDGVRRVVNNGDWHGSLVALDQMLDEMLIDTQPDKSEDLGNNDHSNEGHSSDDQNNDNNNQNSNNDASSSSTPSNQHFDTDFINPKLGQTASSKTSEADDDNNNDDHQDASSTSISSPSSSSSKHTVKTTDSFPSSSSSSSAPDGSTQLLLTQQVVTQTERQHAKSQAKSMELESSERMVLRKLLQSAQESSSPSYMNNLNNENVLGVSSDSSLSGGSESEEVLPSRVLEKIGRSKWVFLSDDSHWVNIPALLNQLERYDPQCPLAFAYVWSHVLVEDIDYASISAGVLLSQGAIQSLLNGRMQFRDERIPSNELGFSKMLWTRGVQLVHKNGFHSGPPVTSRDRLAQTWYPQLGEALSYEFDSLEQLALMTEYANERWLFQPPNRTITTETGSDSESVQSGDQDQI